jgi:hypothetical protein
MSGFGMEIETDRAVILRFEKFPKDMHDALFATLTRLERRLEAAVQSAEPVETGALRAMTGGRVYDHGDRMAAVVGVRAESGQDARRAAALEFGSHRNITVRAHEAKLGHLWARAISPITVSMPSHQRMTNIQPIRFLRNAIDMMSAEAVAEMRLAVGVAIAQEA